MLLAVGCGGDSVSPRVPEFAESPTVGRITGLGQVGTGSQSPGNPVLGFDFDVRADLTGRLAAYDYSDVRYDGSVGSLHVDPADAETGITAFRTSSSACSDPSAGVEFDGIGREDPAGAGLVGFTVVACDNGPAGSGLDFFRLTVPHDGYERSGPVTSGDIVRSTVPVTPGDLTVTTSTTGSSFAPDSYTVTVDETNSERIGVNGSLTFTGLAPGSHSVALSEVPANCTVSGGAAQAVTVPSGGTASTTFAVTCGPVATRLVFTIQPRNALPYPLGTIPPVEVTAVDDLGNRATGFSGPVTIAIGHNAGLLLPGTLRGTTTGTTVGGIATFSDLSIDQPGIGYTLVATASTLTDAESAGFTILTPLPIP